MAVFGAAGSGGAETDLAQRRQILWQPTGAQAFPDGTRQSLLSGPEGLIIESLQAAATGQDPEDLGDLHHGVVVFGGCGIGAKNMFQPDPVVFLGIERVFDQVPFSAAVVDHDGHALGREI